MNINDQEVIDYIKDKGDLVDLWSWRSYLNKYSDPYGKLEEHFKHCYPVDGDLELVEKSYDSLTKRLEGKKTFLMEVHGVECECGKYFGLGYVLPKSFYETVLDVLREKGVNVEVNFKRHNEPM